jgi:phosphate-selective porin OprO/OprP
MHGGISSWCIWTVAAIMLAAATVVVGQESPTTAPTEVDGPPVAAGQQKAFEVQPSGDDPPAPEANSPEDLARRVAELEDRLGRAAGLELAPWNRTASRLLVVPSGRIQLDAANFSQNAASHTQFGNVPNAVGFRRARIALLGEAFDVTDYVIEMDFANRGAAAVINSKDQSTGFKDVYAQVRELPLLGNVRVGHFKEPFGLEQIPSDNFTTFMERSVDDEGTFVPGRNNGIMAFNRTENLRATWAIGGFTNHTGFDQPPSFQFDHWGLDLAMRGTYLAWYDEASDGRGLLHTGLGYVYRSAPDHTQIFAARPESAWGPAIVNLTLTGVDNSQVFGGETALVCGPLSLQSEAFVMSVNRTSGATNSFYGCYAYASYFLTGESRPYNRKMGTFDRVRPFENFFRVRTADGDVKTGRGAWELAYRISYIDMLDGLAPSATTSGAGIDIFEMRFGIDF